MTTNDTFQVGDRIKNVGRCSSKNGNAGKFGKVTSICGCTVYVQYEDGTTGNDTFPGSCYQKVSSCGSKNMNIREKFVLALTAEPKKSFRKAGITNGDDLLTDEGVKIFLTWLLHNKYAADFKTEVVDGILSEQEDED